MDFELKSLSPEQSVDLAVDALLVLVPDNLPKAQGKALTALSELIEDAAQRGDRLRVSVSLPAA